jgi:excisionase family DNA binding protein
MPDGDLIRIGEAANMIGISHATLRRLADSGKIRSFHVGASAQRRFLRSDILALLRERQATGNQTPQEGETDD